MMPGSHLLITMMRKAAGHAIIERATRSVPDTSAVSTFATKWPTECGLSILAKMMLSHSLSKATRFRGPAMMHAHAATTGHRMSATKATAYGARFRTKGAVMSSAEAGTTAWSAAEALTATWSAAKTFASKSMVPAERTCRRKMVTKTTASSESLAATAAVKTGAAKSAASTAETSATTMTTAMEAAPTASTMTATSVACNT